MSRFGSLDVAESGILAPKNWCITQSPIVPITFSWSIKNFSYHIREPGYFLRSSTFSSEGHDGIKWYLKVYPNGLSKENENHISIFLIPDFEIVNATTIKLQVSLLDKHNKKSLFSRGGGSGSENTCKVKSLQGLGWPKFMETAVLRQKSAELLPDDILTVYCEVYVPTDTFTVAGKIRSSKIPDHGLGDDFASLFNKELFSDVTLTAHGEKFKVHKNILAARSSVFAAMFTGDMKEKNQDVIEIADIDNNVLRDLLYFIYSEKPPIHTRITQTTDLFAAADKYDLKRLKLICEDDLRQKIAIDNAPDLLLLAYLHNAEELKTTVLEFIYSHATAIMKSENWSSVLRHPQLLNEVLEYRVQRDSHNMNK